MMDKLVCERQAMPMSSEPEKYWVITLWCIREECALWKKATWWRKGKCGRKK